jgi:hypothetical protein
LGTQSNRGQQKSSVQRAACRCRCRCRWRVEVPPRGRHGAYIIRASLGNNLQPRVDVRSVMAKPPETHSSLNWATIAAVCSCQQALGSFRYLRDTSAICSTFGGQTHQQHWTSRICLRAGCPNNPRHGLPEHVAKWTFNNQKLPVSGGLATSFWACGEILYLRPMGGAYCCGSAGQRIPK